MYKKNLIAGVDEVGRGSLAGPVVAAAVIFKNSHIINGIRDSKKISFKSRNYLARLIKKNSYFGIGVASVKEIQKYNILGASLLSMTRALKNDTKIADVFGIVQRIRERNNDIPIILMGY